MRILNFFTGFSVLTSATISFGFSFDVNQYFTDGWKKQIIPFASDIQNANAPKRSVKE